MARSSGDLSSVGINIQQRERLLAAMGAINRLRRALLDLARRHTDSIMPGYSFGQHAQPMTLAHLWLSWVVTLARDFGRHAGAYQRVNASPAGAAIMVGSDFNVDRKRTAELLGFDTMHENCADAILELTADDSIEVPMVFPVRAAGQRVHQTLARDAPLPSKQTTARCLTRSEASTMLPVSAAATKYFSWRNV